ncbi:hypothetical protein [Jatrophihabitans sp.]|uniref:hypothetical protein n=1 Tax=Jatrophihabitans sp. TaxID=1932789 RepID=UPI0030C73D87|nr:hypothetical protein [Jatrophihabitans sp.]
MSVLAPAYRLPTADQLVKYPALEQFPGVMIWHKAARAPYYVENSFRGLHHAHKLGANAIDGDGNLSAEAIALLTHWGKPLEHDFHDPAPMIHRMPRNTPTRRMALPEVGRLRAPGGFRIRTLGDALGHAAGLGMSIGYEAKDDPRFEDVEVWERIRLSADVAHAHVFGMTLQHLGGERHAAARCRAMRAAGVPALLLNRGPVNWSIWGDALDGYKGSTAHYRGHPAHVVRLGLGAGDATRYGASCHDGNVHQVKAAIARASRR